MATTAVPAGAAAPRLALVVLLAGAVTLSLSGTLAKLSEVGPVATAFHRVALSLPVFFAWLWLAEGGEAVRPPRRRLPILALGGLFFAADLATWHWGLRLTSVANATLLGNGAPIFVTLGGWLLLGERITPTFLVGLALAMAGAAVMIGGDLSLDPRALSGDLLSIATAAFYGGYILSLKRLRSRLSTAASMGWTGVFAALALLPLALLTESTLLPRTATGWGTLLALALMAQAAAVSMIVWALAHLPASFSAVTLLINPVAAALLAWPILGETIRPTQLVGGTVVLLGILVSRRGSQPPGFRPTEPSRRER
jgi:drug/metabolite transporter (DMT)-like permease